VCDKNCIFFFFPIINIFLMAKRSLISECPSYKHNNTEQSRRQRGQTEARIFVKRATRLLGKVENGKGKSPRYRVKNGTTSTRSSQKLRHVECFGKFRIFLKKNIYSWGDFANIAYVRGMSICKTGSVVSMCACC
jgi:hypothetical protein